MSNIIKLDPNAVVRALEKFSVECDHPDFCCMSLKLEKITSQVRSMADQWDELVECKEALEWLVKHGGLKNDGFDLVVFCTYGFKLKDCPAIIKQMIGDK